MKATRNASPRTTCAVLNGLIVACYDDIRAQRGAALIVGSPPRQQRLEDSALRRTAFINELGHLVRELGGTPDDGGSSFEAVRHVLGSVRSLVIGDNTGDAYASCARIETKAEELYEHATDARLPETARAVVARQHTEIASDRLELRRLRIEA